jgi:hypothetical protein
MVLIKSLFAIAVVLKCTLTADAHLAVWQESMYGSEPGNINSNHAVQPLRDLPFDQWWFHGDMNSPPPANAVTKLPAGGKIDLEIADNKAFTSMGRGLLPNPRDPPVPWKNMNDWGNMHANNRNDVAGCALGIAYKSNPQDVKPEDFAIFSVVHDCPARQLQTFEIPNLPQCPNGRCQCAWFWIHESSGGTDQMYMSPFVCNVTGGTNNQTVGKAIPSRKCDDDKSKCVVGAKQPMYWMVDGANMPEPAHYAPTYSTSYNFQEGAQTDIFTDGRVTSKK